ncbi:MAG: hypothetical protein ACRC1H_00055 [Caldilineaceae bacterium]
MSDSPQQPWYPANVEQKARSLHERALEQDVTAISELAHLLVPWMQEGVKRQWPRAEEADVVTAVTDAFMAYRHRPEIYQPDKGPMVRFMVMAAVGDLRNLYDKQKRYDKRFPGFPQSVANDGDEQENEVESGVDEDMTDLMILMSRNAELEANIIGLFPDPIDRQVLDLIVQSVRQFEIYAMVMQIEHLPIDEQRKRVKRARDRIRIAAIRHRNELLLGSAQTSHD